MNLDRLLSGRLVISVSASFQVNSIKGCACHLTTLTLPHCNRNVFSLIAHTFKSASRRIAEDFPREHFRCLQTFLLHMLVYSFHHPSRERKIFRFLFVEMIFRMNYRIISCFCSLPSLHSSLFRLNKIEFTFCATFPSVRRNSLPEDVYHVIKLL